MSDSGSVDIDEILKALAHPARREILVWLKTPQSCFPGQRHSFDAGVCAGQIHEKAGLCASTVSAHLAVLQRAGLVKTEKIGQWIFYSRNEDVIEAFVKQIPLVF